MADPEPAYFRQRSRIDGLGSLLLFILLTVPKALSLLVPRRRRLILIGAGRDHLDNILGVLMSKPGPPTEFRIVVLANKPNRQDPRLQAALATIPGARIVRKFSPLSVWMCLRAGWILVPAARIDVWRFWLGHARLVYVNHGAWLKTMNKSAEPDLVFRVWTRLFGRYVIALASHDGEVSDYLLWLDPGLKVCSLGYPRSALLDQVRARGLNPSKVGIYPTWKEFPDPTFQAGVARRVYDVMVGMGIDKPCVEFRPHHLAPEKGVTLGVDDGRRPGILITDFSSVAFDQFYLGGKVLLYSRVATRYLRDRGIRPPLEVWLRDNLVDSEAALEKRLRNVLDERDAGVPTPFELKPFRSGEFWETLQLS